MTLALWMFRAWPLWLGLLLVSCRTPQAESQTAESQTDTEMPSQTTAAPTPPAAERAAPSADSAVVPADLMRGDYLYFAEVASFRPCEDDSSHPLMRDSIALQLERRYLREVAQPPKPMLVELQGQWTEAEDISGRTRKHLKVTAIHRVVPDQNCED